MLSTNEPLGPLRYVQASFTLPGVILPQFLSPESLIIGDVVTFVRNGSCVEARVKPFYLPTEQAEICSRNPAVQAEVIVPTIQLVSADLATIDSLLPQLQSLYRSNVIMSLLEFSHHPDLSPQDSDSKYRVYDFSNYSNGFRLFDRLKHLVDPDYFLSKKEVPLPVMDLAALVNSELRDPSLPSLRYVSGPTLKEAVEKAINIYESAGILEVLEFVLRKI